MKVYLDACTLNRLSDEQAQPRIRAEAQAVEQVFATILNGACEWSASPALQLELLQNPDAEKRKQSLTLLAYAGPLERTTKQIISRGKDLAQAGYGTFDALHLAYAEAAQVDALLTTDDRFLRRAARGTGHPTVRTINPVDWLLEVHAWHRQKQ